MTKRKYEIGQLVIIRTQVQGEEGSTWCVGTIAKFRGWMIWSVNVGDKEIPRPYFDECAVAFFIEPKHHEQVAKAFAMTYFSSCEKAVAALRCIRFEGYAA